jgi:hypothetical protein
MRVMEKEVLAVCRGTQNHNRIVLTFKARIDPSRAEIQIILASDKSGD